MKSSTFISSLIFVSACSIFFSCKEGSSTNTEIREENYSYRLIKKSSIPHHWGEDFYYVFKVENISDDTISYGIGPDGFVIYEMIIADRVKNKDGYKQFADQFTLDMVSIPPSKVDTLTIKLRDEICDGSFHLISLGKISLVVNDGCY